MEIKIVTSKFNPWDEVQQFQSNNEHIKGKFGATSLFVGTMRDFNEGEDVKEMTLEHYPGMTEKQLSIIISTAMDKWNILDVLIIHKVGQIFPDDAIVLVAVWSSHRGDAFDTSRYIMEALKSKAPFWKREILLSNTKKWVENNSSGYKDTKRK